MYLFLMEYFRVRYYGMKMRSAEHWCFGTVDDVSGVDLCYILYFKQLMT